MIDKLFCLDWGQEHHTLEQGWATTTSSIPPESKRESRKRRESEREKASNRSRPAGRMTHTHTHILSKLYMWTWFFFFTLLTKDTKYLVKCCYQLVLIAMSNYTANHPTAFNVCHVCVFLISIFTHPGELVAAEKLGNQKCFFFINLKIRK